MMKRVIVLGTTMAVLLGFGATAQAALITFGPGDVDPAGASSYSTTVGGTTLDVIAQPGGATFTTSSGGLGIDGGGYDIDESEAPEYFEIVFNAPATNVILNLSKFFSNDPGFLFGSFAEEGAYAVNGGGLVGFQATATNGSYLLDLSGLGSISSITLSGIGTHFSLVPPVLRNSEFALKSIEFTPAAVPEPVSLTLLGLGLATIGYRMRRRA